MTTFKTADDAFRHAIQIAEMLFDSKPGDYTAKGYVMYNRSIVRALKAYQKLRKMESEK
jgi:hypothetical protein